MFSMPQPEGGAPSPIFFGKRTSLIESPIRRPTVVFCSKRSSLFLHAVNRSPTRPFTETGPEQSVADALLIEAYLGLGVGVASIEVF